MRLNLWLLAALFISYAMPQASASSLTTLTPGMNLATWYVRQDGGTKPQCTGLTNAPYPGSGTGVDCAVNHPYWLLDQSAWTWIIATNDTVQFEDVGPYHIGQQNTSGDGQSWAHCSAQPQNCYAPPLPNGVKFYGKNVGVCHTTMHTATLNPTQFVGINHLFQFLDVSGTNNDDIECIDITQKATCTSQGKTDVNVLTTELNGTVAKYGWQYPGYDESLTTDEPVSVTGTTNGSGTFNVNNSLIQTLTYSQYTITGTQSIDSTHIVYSWTLVSGFPPQVGQTAVIVSGTTNGSGAFNINGAGTDGPGGRGAITAVSGTTSGTFTYHLTDTSTVSVVGFQAESGTGTNGDSGYFTLNHASGTVASASDSGTIYFAGWCDDPVGQSGDFLGTGLMMSYGAGTQGPSNLTVKDVSIHGLKNDLIHGGKWNTTSTDTTTFQDIYLGGGGDSGWNYDSNGCGTDCESVGHVNISYVNAGWAGFAEVEPNGGTIGGNGWNYGVDQWKAGNGDCITMLATGATWSWTHINIHDCAQDSFDALHVGDDPVTRPITTASYIYAEGSEGQSIKGGGGQFTLTDSIGISNCNYLSGDVAGNPDGFNALLGSLCRANDGMAFGMQDGDQLTIENVTNITEQNVAWDIANQNCTSAANCTFTFKDNATLGFVSPVYSTYPGGLYFGGPELLGAGSSVADHNAWYHMGSSGTTCPTDAHETNYLCLDPKFAAESNVNAMDVHLQSSSPLLGAGVTISGLTTDYAGTTRPAPPSIGAFEAAVIAVYSHTLGVVHTLGHIIFH